MATTQKECETRYSDTSQTYGSPHGQGGQNQNRGATQRSSDTMQNMQDKIKNAAQDIASTAKDQGQHIASKAKDKTASFMADQQHQAAAKIEGVAEAARRAAETLREHGDDNVAGYAETAADQMAAFSHYLRDRRPNDLLRDLEDAAARHPAVVYGGLFIAGLALSRFLKASDRSRGHRTMSDSPSWS